MENSNGNTVHTVKVDVIAKDNSGNVLGKGTCKQYAKTQEGLDHAVKDLGIEKIVGDLNRQLKTDTRNALARGGPSITKDLRDTRKSLTADQQAAYDTELRKLMEKFRN